jgi:hypothetical protein
VRVLRLRPRTGMTRRGHGCRTDASGSKYSPPVIRGTDARVQGGVRHDRFGER